MKANYLKLLVQITAGGIALLGLAFPHLAFAQFTGDNQTNIIDGTSLNWTGNYYIGSNYVFNSLFIVNGGSLSNAYAYIGRESGSNSNVVTVSGNGSRWSSSQSIYVGYEGSDNRLVINDGGSVQSPQSSVVVGSQNTSLSNRYKCSEV